MIPRILKNFQGFIDGVGYAGLVDEVELPEVAIKTEEHRAGGMDGNYEVDMGMETMSAKITMAEPRPELLGALMTNKRVQLRGSFVRDTDGSRVSVVVAMGARQKKLTLGSWKAGDKNQNEQEYTLDYFRLVVGGVEILEIDIVNMVRRVRGVDQLAGIRADIGM